MHIGKARHARDLFIQPRIMLHRATSQREEAQINRVILTAEARVMADGFRLGQTRKANVTVPFQIAKARGDLWGIGQIDARRAGRANLENQCLFKHQRLVAGEGRRGGVACLAHFGLPSTLIDRVHAKISCKAAANVSTSSLVAVSVTATSRPFESASAPG